jgi:acyl dehydratase
MRYLADYAAGMVERFGSYPVTREEVIEFAGRYDPQAFHLSDDAAAKTYFGGLAASGWHTCAMTMRMYVDHMKAVDHAGLGGSAVDELRWPVPVHPGDTLRAEREILEVRQSRSRPEMGVVRARMTTFNQHDVVVLSFNVIDFVAVGPVQAPQRSRPDRV